jgi:hypothetical protein
MEPSPGTRIPSVSDPDDLAARWQRWPCHRCGHEERSFLLLCPECDALPWEQTDPSGKLSPPAGSEIEVRSRGLIRNQFRFSTPAGFLGVLSRRFSGGGDWLGVDGAEWRIERQGWLGFGHILRHGSRALAGAEAPGLVRGLFRSDFELRQDSRSWRFHRTGLARSSFSLVGDDESEVLRLHGGLFDPLRRVEVLDPTPLPTLVLAAYLACGLRQGEGEA